MAHTLSNQYRAYPEQHRAANGAGVDKISARRFSAVSARDGNVSAAGNNTCGAANFDLSDHYDATNLSALTAFDSLAASF